MVYSSEDNFKIKRKWCSLDQGGWFVVLGVLLIITAFLHGVIYFSIRTLTSSLDIVETVPNYATALLVCCTGILVLFLSKRRDLAFVVPTVLLALVCVGLCASSAILTWLKVLVPMSRFTFCAYSQTEGQCRCYTNDNAEPLNYSQNNTAHWPVQDKVYIYKGSRSCHAIEHNLKDLVITQCVLYSTDFVMSVMALLLITYFIRKNMVPLKLCPPQIDDEAEDQHPLALLESSSSSYDWCIQYLHRQLALPGYTTNSYQSSRQSGCEMQCLGCQMHSDRSVPIRQTPHPRCQVTELPDHCGHNSAHDQSDISCDVVPYVSAGVSSHQGSGDRNARDLESRNAISLLNFRRHQDGVPESGNQNGSYLQRDQVLPRTHHSHVSRRSRRCSSRHDCRHRQHRNRPRSRPRGTGLATMMPLSAWNLGRHPLPLEPPPPYRPWQLPPYLEDDPAPSYRSRVTTPANSICGNLE